MQSIIVKRPDSLTIDQGSSVSFSSFHGITYENLRMPVEELENIFRLESALDHCYSRWGRPLMECFICLIIDKNIPIDIGFLEKISLSNCPPRKYEGISTGQYNALKVDFKHMASASGIKGLFCTMNCKKPSKICLGYTNFLLKNNHGSPIGVNLAGVSDRAKICLDKLKKIQTGKYSTKKSRVDKLKRTLMYERDMLKRLRQDEKTSINEPKVDPNVEDRFPRYSNPTNMLRAAAPEVYEPLNNNYKLALLKRADVREDRKIVIEQLKMILSAKRKNVVEVPFKVEETQKKEIPGKRPKFISRVHHEKINEVILKNKFEILRNLEETLEKYDEDSNNSLGKGLISNVVLPKCEVFSEESKEIVKSLFMRKNKTLLQSKRQKRMRYNLLCWANGYPHEKLSSRILSMYIKASTIKMRFHNFKQWSEKLDDVVDNIITEHKQGVKCFRVSINPNVVGYVFKKRVWRHSRTKRKSEYRFRKVEDHLITEMERPIKKQNTRREEPYGIRILDRPKKIIKPKVIPKKKPARPVAKPLLECEKTNVMKPLREVVFELDHVMVADFLDNFRRIEKTPIKMGVKEMLENVKSVEIYKNNIKFVKNLSKINEMAMSNYLTDLKNCDWEQIDITPPMEMYPKEYLANKFKVEEVLLASNLILLYQSGVNAFTTLERCTRALGSFINSD